MRALGILAVGALLATSCASSPQLLSAKNPLFGQPMPSFHRQTVQGGRFKTDDAAGRVLVIEFFAKFCQPCQKRLRTLDRLREEFPEAVFLGVSLDETFDAALEQVRLHGLRFPVIHDSGHILSGRFRISALPAACVVGDDGKVAWVGGPEHPEQALRQAALEAERVRSTHLADGASHAGRGN